MNLIESIRSRFNRVPVAAFHEVQRYAREMREVAGRESDNSQLLQERLAELELAIEDLNWSRLANEQQRELSREGLRRIMTMSRLFFLKNPLINRAVTLQAFYVWGQGVTIKAEDEKFDEVLQAFLIDRGNKAEMWGHQARTLKEMELQVTGNLFLTFFADTLDTGTVRMRSIPADEIHDIISNPDDRKEQWFYRRQFVQRTLNPETGETEEKNFVQWYPDWEYQPADKPQRIGQYPVMWDAPVCHIKVGGLADMLFGVPETYAAMDWARASKDYLEDWATFSKALSMFAWQMKVKGGKRSVAAAKSKIGTTFADGVPVSADTNPPPVRGSVSITSEGAELNPIKIAGSNVSPSDVKQMHGYVSAATGLPQTMLLGDADLGNYATAETLDRPTELKFVDRQELWKDVIQQISDYVGQCAMDAGQLADGTDTTVHVNFPPILSHNILQSIQAIVAANGTGRIDPETVTRQICSALGINDVDAVLEALEKIDAEKPEPVAQPEGKAGAETEPSEKDDTTEAWRSMTEAIRDLRNLLAAA